MPRACKQQASRGVRQQVSQSCATACSAQWAHDPPRATAGPCKRQRSSQEGSRQWQDAVVSLPWPVSRTHRAHTLALHCVCLARACLTVCNDRGVVALQRHAAVMRSALTCIRQGQGWEQATPKQRGSVGGRRSTQLPSTCSTLCTAPRADCAYTSSCVLSGPYTRSKPKR